MPNYRRDGRRSDPGQPGSGSAAKLTLPIPLRTLLRDSNERNLSGMRSSTSLAHDQQQGEDRLLIIDPPFRDHGDQSTLESDGTLAGPRHASPLDNMSQPRRPFQTDALNPSALPGSSRRHLPSRPLPGLDPDADTLADGDRQKVLLQAEYEEWNQRIDREMKACAGGLKELVSLADVRLYVPNPRMACSSLTARTESLG